MDRRGLTLVEIIVAMALIGIISAGFLTVLSNNFNFLNQTKEITADAFRVQQQVEEEIDRVRGLIPQPGNGGLTRQTMTVFEGVTVNYFEVAEDDTPMAFYTYVSDTRMPSFSQLIVSDVNTTIRNGLSSTLYADPIADVNIQGTFTNDVATIRDLMLNTFAWYQSTDGFNIPVPQGNNPANFHYMRDMTESEFINRYPIFPNDFELIPDQTSADLTNVEDYAGRQLVLLVTPAAKSGRLGTPGVSEPILVSGLKQLNNLVLHLDASYIDPYNTTEVNDATNRKVLRWYDMDSGVGQSLPTEWASQTAANSGTVIDTDVNSEFIGRFVRFDATKSMAINAQGTSGRTIHVFAVVKGIANKKILVNNSDRPLILTNDLSNRINAEDWYLIYDTYASTSDTFTLGNDAMDVAELLVYEGALTPEYITAIREYINKKYARIQRVENIVELMDMNVQIFEDTAYTLPSTILADMVYGPDSNVLVNWTPNVADTNTPGTYTFTGTSVTDTRKTMTLTLLVKPKVLVSSIDVLPADVTLITQETAQLTATIAPANATNPAYVWISSNPAVATVSASGLVTAVSPGSVTITAQTIDGNRTDTCNITVNPYVAVAWEFASGLEGWTATNMASTPTFGVTSGIMTGKSNSVNGAYIQSSNLLNLDLSRGKKVVIRLKNASTSTNLRITFVTNANTSYDTSNKMLDFTIAASSSSFVDYTFDMSSKSYWTGTLRQIRIYPVRGVNAANFEIDYIRIVE